MIRILTPPLAAMAALLLSVSGAFAEPKTIYVSENGDDDQEDVGTEWAKAYRNIQPAVDAAVEGDTVLVGDGTYYAVNTTTNYVLRVAKRINILSVNGRDHTIIDGANVAADGTITYCNNRQIVALTSAATGVFAGFTCTNGTANIKPSGAGGLGSNGFSASAGFVTNIAFHIRSIREQTACSLSGTVQAYDVKMLYCSRWESAGEMGTPLGISGSAVVDRLEVTGQFVGDSSRTFISLAGTCTLRNSLIAENRIGKTTSSTCKLIATADKNAKPTIENCTVANNVQSGTTPIFCVANDQSGNGTTMRNCIFYGNTVGGSTVGADFNSYVKTNRVYNTCSIALVGQYNGCIVSNPQFVDPDNGDFSLQLSSRCVNVGENRPWMEGAVDFAGNGRIFKDVVDMGCYELQRDPAEAGLTCGFDIVGDIEGHHSLTTKLTGFTNERDESGLTCAWVFSDGTTLTGWPTVEKTFTIPGRYSCTLYVTNAVGKTAEYSAKDAFTVIPKRCYVRADNGNGTYPWDTRERGTTNLVAVLAMKPDEVQVADGEFRLPLPSIVANYGLRIFSENGPEHTTLRSPASGSAPGYYVNISSPEAEVSGFTFTGGCAASAGNTTIFYATDGMISNCVVRGFGPYPVWKSTASTVSGNAKILDVTFDFNKANFPGQNDGNNTVISFSGGLMERCKFLNAKMSSTKSLVSAVVKVSGTAVLRNSLIMNCTNQIASTAGYSGAAFYASGGSIENCTFVSNSCATTEAGLWIKGTAAVTNCIIGLNSALGAAKDFCNEAPETTSVSHSLSPDLQGGVNGNISAQPLFKKNTLYLRASSPGSHVGIMLPWMTEDAIDLAGNRRVVGGTPDIGCYESRNPGLMLLVR